MIYGIQKALRAQQTEVPLYSPQIHLQLDECLSPSFNVPCISPDNVKHPSKGLDADDRNLAIF